MGDRDDDTARVYVGGLNEGVKKEDLESEFEKYGKLNSVWVAFNPPGFAFIEFNNLSDAETACDNLNGTDFLGAKLRVEIARGKSRRGGGFRGGRGRGGPPFRGYSSSGSSDRSYRGGGGGGGRGGRSRYDGGYGRRDGRGSSGGGSRYGGRDFNRRSDGFSGRSDGYSSSGGGSGRGGGGRRFDGNSRFRSRSPTSGGSRH